MQETAPASQSVVPDPQNYTITFNNDGSASHQGRLQQCGGTYKVNGSDLTITSREVDAFADTVKTLLQSGHMGIGLPLPGSKQGWTLDAAARLVDCIHEGGALAWAIVTGSVEGGPREAMIGLALQAKMLGFDVHRLDEAGLSGMPSPENIMSYSLAIRGECHTYRRMALSIRR